MNKRWYSLVLVLAVGLIACGGPAKAVAFAQVCDKANEQQRISTEGYFSTGSSVFCSNIGSSTVQCGLTFVENAGDTAGFSADVDQGDGDNEIEDIPDDFTDETITIHADDGSVVRIGDKVRASGKMVIGEGVCLMNVDLIEPIK
jgi:hypothetical protein